MNFPTPPTDSLYKFMAIAGIVLTLLGITLTFSLVNDQNSKVGQYAVAAQIARTKADEVQSEHSRNLTRLRELDKRIAAKAGALNTDQQGTDTRERSVLLDREKALIEPRNQVERDAAEMSVKSELLKSNQKNLMWSIKALGGAGGIGFAFAVVGFILWYKHIQIHQDKTARLDAEYRALDVKLHHVDLTMKQTELALKKLELEEKQKANPVILGAENNVLTDAVKESVPTVALLASGTENKDNEEVVRVVPAVAPLPSSQSAPPPSVAVRRS